MDELLADPMRVSSSKGRRACFARWQLFVTLMISILVCSSTVRLDLNTISFEVCVAAVATGPQQTHGPYA